MKEFECRICFEASESAIRSKLEKALPSLQWEEGDSSWDKIRVWGTSPDTFISVFRYEGPGPFKLRIRVPTLEGIDTEQTYIALREKVLTAINANIWKPLEPQPVFLIKLFDGFPAAYEFESEFGIGKIKSVLYDSELWYWEQYKRPSGELYFEGRIPFRLTGKERPSAKVRIHLTGDRPAYKIEVGRWPDEPGQAPTCDQVHETVQSTLLPALGARIIRAA
jgi:hypothetical protein